MDKIEVTTEYTYPVFKKFFNFVNYQRSVGRIIYWIVLDAILLIATVMAVIATVMTKDYTVMSYVIILIVFLTVFQIVLPRISYKGQIASRCHVETDIFSEENIKTVGTAKVGQMNQIFYWEGLHSAYETKGFFYIFVARNQGLIVDKSKMSAQEITWLGGLLASKLGNKYKIK